MPAREKGRSRNEMRARREAAIQQERLL